ncbi:MAG: hypothetical protein Q8P01_02055 [bacterium]|nr:hypothetical protein [bacterium]MDP2703984.1 hypothetical protein [bacterium]
MPTYRKDFEKDTRWRSAETEHYVFHFFPDSVAAKDIDAIKTRQESAYQKIITFLGVPVPKRKISYYFYPNEVTKTALMGDPWYAQSIYDEFRVHVLYTETVKPIGEHEDAHLLSLPWGLSIGLFQEGLAEHFSCRNWEGRDHDECVREGYKRGVLPSVTELMDHISWSASADEHAIYFYSLAGAFTKFLIKKFGKEKFRELYQNTNREKSAKENAVVFAGVYGAEVEEVETPWRRETNNT